jgi:hypothetical protein
MVTGVYMIISYVLAGVVFFVADLLVADSLVADFFAGAGFFFESGFPLFPATTLSIGRNATLELLFFFNFSSSYSFNSTPTWAWKVFKTSSLWSVRTWMNPSAAAAAALTIPVVPI